MTNRSTSFPTRLSIDTSARRAVTAGPLRGNARRGSIYVLTLVAAVVIVALVLGISYHTIQFRQSSQVSGDIDRSYVYAELGLRHALHFVQTTDDWRGLVPDGVWLSDVAAGDGVYSISGTDPLDGNLQNNASDPLLITCTAKVDGIERTLSVEAEGQPLALLKYAISATGDIDIEDDCGVFGSVYSQTEVEGEHTVWVTGNVEYRGNDTDYHGSIGGELIPECPEQEFPDIDAIITYYRGIATEIPYQAYYNNFILSTNFSTISAGNPEGVYVINCGGNNVTFDFCILDATIILIEPDNFYVRDVIRWVPQRDVQPALLIKAPVGQTVRVDGGSFPTTWDALIASGNIVLEDLNWYGPIFCDGEVRLDEHMRCSARDSYYEDPPPGFITDDLHAKPGTCRELLP